MRSAPRGVATARPALLFLQPRSGEWELRPFLIGTVRCAPQALLALAVCLVDSVVCVDISGQMKQQLVECLQRHLKPQPVVVAVGAVQQDIGMLCSASAGVLVLANEFHVPFRSVPAVADERATEETHLKRGFPSLFECSHSRQDALLQVHVLLDPALYRQISLHGGEGQCFFKTTTGRRLSAGCSLPLFDGWLRESERRGAEEEDECGGGGAGPCEVLGHKASLVQGSVLCCGNADILVHSLGDLQRILLVDALRQLLIHILILDQCICSSGCLLAVTAALSRSCVSFASERAVFILSLLWVGFGAVAAALVAGNLFASALQRPVRWSARTPLPQRRLSSSSSANNQTRLLLLLFYLALQGALSLLCLWIRRRRTSWQWIFRSGFEGFLVGFLLRQMLRLGEAVSVSGLFSVRGFKSFGVNELSGAGEESGKGCLCFEACAALAVFLTVRPFLLAVASGGSSARRRVAAAFYRQMLYSGELPTSSRSARTAFETLCQTAARKSERLGSGDPTCSRVSGVSQSAFATATHFLPRRSENGCAENRVGSPPRQVHVAASPEAAEDMCGQALSSCALDGDAAERAGFAFGESQEVERPRQTATALSKRRCCLAKRPIKMMGLLLLAAVTALVLVPLSLWLLLTLCRFLGAPRDEGWKTVSASMRLILSPSWWLLLWLSSTVSLFVSWLVLTLWGGIVGIEEIIAAIDRAVKLVRISLREALTGVSSNFKGLVNSKIFVRFKRPAGGGRRKDFYRCSGTEDEDQITHKRSCSWKGCTRRSRQTALVASSAEAAAIQASSCQICSVSLQGVKCIGVDCCECPYSPDGCFGSWVRSTFDTVALRFINQQQTSQRTPLLDRISKSRFVSSFQRRSGNRVGMALVSTNEGCELDDRACGCKHEENPQKHSAESAVSSALESAANDGHLSARGNFCVGCACTRQCHRHAAQREELQREVVALLPAGRVFTFSISGSDTFWWLRNAVCFRQNTWTIRRLLVEALRSVLGLTNGLTARAARPREGFGTQEVFGLRVCSDRSTDSWTARKEGCRESAIPREPQKSSAARGKRRVAFPTLPCVCDQLLERQRKRLGLARLSARRTRWGKRSRRVVVGGRRPLRWRS